MPAKVGGVERVVPCRSMMDGEIVLLFGPLSLCYSESVEVGVDLRCAIESMAVVGVG